MSEDFRSPVDYPEPFRELAVELANSAARSLCIQSPLLDREVFDNEALSDALRSLARGGRQTEARILINDSRPLVQRGHRLLQLARRIPSNLQIRRLRDHPDWNGETVVIRDRDGVLYQPGGTEKRGFYEPDSRASTQRHLERFDELWRLGTVDTELRTLSL